MKLPYEEGTWFAIPLGRGGYGVGVVARATKQGRVILGYFFGPWRESVPSLDELASQKPAEAIRVARFGDLSLIRREWPLIGRAANWDRKQWPLPSFARRDEISGLTWRVDYSDDDPNETLAAERVSEDEVAGLERDAVLGAGSVEIVLTKLLSP